MDREKFEELVREGIEAIPQRFLEKLNNVDIIVEDEPRAEQREKLKLRKDVKLFGLYEGVPQTKREYYSWVLPDKITIFKKPIEEVAFDAALSLPRGKTGEPRLWREQRIKEIVKDTVWHEIAHHFGMDEEKVRRAEKRKRQK